MPNRLHVVVLLSALLVLLLPGFGSAGLQPDIPNAASLLLAIQKLGVVGNVLYIAAHPDDENTGLLAYFSLGRKLRTGYLSLTRGDGGQNLIGPEQGDFLGVIRTQELLAARERDGAEQFFGRAVDFGFSKTSEETLRFWGREESLSDVVWVIRKFRPDVVITRFTPTAGGHGNHTASAILAEEAFKTAADPNRFPEQLKWVKPWQAKRLVWNEFSFGGQQPSPESLKVELGDYNPLLGLSYREIAGIARTMHKSQGMGAPEGRGRSVNGFRHLAGEPASSELFDGVELGWKRIPGAEEIAEYLDKARASFQPAQPQEVLPLLQKAYRLSEKHKDNPLVEQKRTEMREAIRACAGLWLEAIAAAPSAPQGGEVSVTWTAINRSKFPIGLRRVRIQPGGGDEAVQQELVNNEPLTGKSGLVIPADAPYSQPYWLRTRRTGHRHQVSQEMVGTADSSPAFRAEFVVAMGDLEIPYEVPVLYRWVDPVDGEKYRSFDVVPEVSVELREPTVVFPKAEGKRISVMVRSLVAAARGSVNLVLPAGWSADPPTHRFEFAAIDDTATFEFQVLPANGARSGRFAAQADIGGKKLGSTVGVIAYPHFAPQRVLRDAEGFLLREDMTRVGTTIGYIAGSGDQVPDALRQVGYRVDLLSDEQIMSPRLDEYDAVVVGIRAYNTRPALRTSQSRLIRYVEGGGTLVVQYNTAQERATDRLGPYPFRISRDRVSVEDSPVQLAQPDHPVLTYPNRITERDFAGWVQERGLYFGEGWATEYQAPLLCADPGETPKAGSLLYARYGKGVFVYTGLAFFRQLPAGVPGAYRLFLNLVAKRNAKPGSSSN